MSTKLTKYKSRSPVRSGSSKDMIMIGGLILVGLLIWYFMRKGQGAIGTPVAQYKNEESWDVQYNADGLPTKITIHRNATQR